MFTVQQIRGDIAPFTLDAGKCKDSAYVIEYINGARRLLWKRGDFPGTVQDLCIRSCDGFMTLPLDYRIARDAQRCGRGVQIDSQWFEYADNVRYDNSCATALIDLGEHFATFKDYRNGNHRLRVMAESSEDVGKKVYINATGEYGDRLSIVATLKGDHEKVDLGPWIKNFRHATKDKTVGRVLVFIYDPNRKQEELCAVYEPDDLAISYRRYRAPYGGSGLYYIKGKKRYRDLLRETDEVEFDTDTLIQACLAITHRRNKDSIKFTAALNLAMEQANQDLKDTKNQTGGAIRLSRQRMVTNLLPAV